MSLESFVMRISQLNPSLDLTKIIKAYRLAEEKHRGQFRKSGEAYLIHPVEVACILAELEMDAETIIAGLLHDVVEDCDVTIEYVTKEFGPDVAVMVDGVTKLGSINYETKEERQAENLRKMVVSMARDIRVILIKMADRLHNMRTLEFMSAEKKKEKAIETLEVFVPLASRLGISRVRWELEDLSLQYLEPEKYAYIVEKVVHKREERTEIVQSIVHQIENLLSHYHIDGEVFGRPKNYYSIYKKMYVKNRNFEEIYDITAIRIILNTEADCYTVLGYIHHLWKPMIGRIKDYIAAPKPNKYQSLHTTVYGYNGEPFEIQIRTKDMHKVAEYGIAAHWKYKEGLSQTMDLKSRLSWIGQFIEFDADLINPDEYMDALKADLFNNQVYVYTPLREVHELPAGSTPIDFAYKVHTQVGNKCIGAKVNNRIVTLSYVLQNGDTVEILTSNNSTGPKRDWLNFVKSTQAKNSIKKWFKKEGREDNIENGRRMLESEIQRQGFQVKRLMVNEYLTDVTKKLKLASVDDLFATVGYGGLKTAQVVPRLREKYKEELKAKQTEDAVKGEEKGEFNFREKKRRPNTEGVIVKGHSDFLVRFAKCCTPVPGDEIIGYVTRGRGVTVHRADCTNFDKDDDLSNRFIEVEWAAKEKKEDSFMASLSISAHDRMGLFNEVTSIVNSMNINLRNINGRETRRGVAYVDIKVDVVNADVLNQLINKIKTIKDVISVVRS